MMFVGHRAYVLGFLLVAVSMTSTVKAEDICVVGYIMDNFCIDRGTLLDMPSVKTLEGPDKHSVHCLVDVASCYESGFEVLVDPPSGTYCRGFTLDPNGNDLALAKARETSTCSTCSGPSGSPTAGFRATIKGKMTKAPSSRSSPGTIEVTSLEDASVGCGDSVYVHPHCNEDSPTGAAPSLGAANGWWLAPIILALALARV
mmetsp:Transcript_57517/g.135045  ORF Transcript_57517/g.135045 Transcript_57517/m.135045 type:complete len:202 (-) Transcript_57517:92-697(-)